jgi:ABC-type Mn2+/Zn2+ transport system ATPase subunit
MIEIKKIAFKRGEIQIFTSLSARIKPGEAVLMSGPNGVGKTTLLQLIGGVLRVQSGEILINGMNVEELSIKEQASIRAVAPQKRNFSLAFTVEEVINFVPKKLKASNIDYIIDTLSLRALMHRKVTELSGGEQERVSLALAFCQKAEYYLLDEPFSAQDSKSTKNIIKVIKTLQKADKGILVISHNQEALTQYFDREIKLS